MFLGQVVRGGRKALHDTKNQRLLAYLEIGFVTRSRDDPTRTEVAVYKAVFALNGQSGVEGE